MTTQRNTHSLLRSAALVCATVFLFAMPGLTQQSPQTITGHVPSAVLDGRARFEARLPATQQLNLSIVLPLRNEAQLHDLLSQLYEPSSPNYHQFLSVAQFTERFGPTADDYQAVMNFAQAHGFTVIGTPPNRMSVPIRGTAAQIEAAFNVNMNVYQHPTENRLFFSPDREPSLNLGVPIKHISGLNSFSPPRPAASIANTQANASGSGPGSSYIASDMRAAYYTNTSGQTGLTGSGQCVGLAEFDGYNVGDVTSTLAPSGGPNTATYTANGSNYTLTYTTGGAQYTIPIINVLAANAGGSLTPDPYAPYNYEGEVVLDIAQVVGMAPGISQVRVYLASDAFTQPSGTNYNFPSNSDDFSMLSQMATDLGSGGCYQLSMSWNWAPEDPLNDPDNYLFAEMASQGQSFFNASGDSGSWPNGGFYYPEEIPNLIAVGGTVLTTNGAGGPWTSESGWSSSGGGISPDGFSIPSYQSGLSGINGTSTVYRNAPDVAMEANGDNYVCDTFANPQCAGNWQGTSFAAPRWAAFMALVNQQAAATGYSTKGLGLINSAIYPIGEGSNYLTDFNEIVGGGNGGYSVTTGQYNLVTGWGSPKGQNLINAMTEPSGPTFRPTQYSCIKSGNGTVSNPQGPTLANGGSVTMRSQTNGSTDCTYSAFTTSTYITTVPMTLSFNAYASNINGGIATVSVSLFGTVISGSYSGKYSVTIPANTDLSTLSVEGYTKVFVTNPPEQAEVQLGTMTIQ